MQRILICGDRNWTDYEFFVAAMLKWIAKHGVPKTIIEGCARGADSMAGHQWAVEIDEPKPYVEHYPAKWEQHDSYEQTCWCKDKSVEKCRGAGPIRNQAMLNHGRPDAVIAFHKDIASSRGTADMVKRARKAGIPVWIPFPQPQQELGL